MKRWLFGIIRIIALLLTVGALSLVILRERGLILFSQEAAPEAWEVFGVDVSAYQGEVDWDVLAEQGVEFAFIKATEGSGYADRYFLQNWVGAQRAGILTGAYHFFSYDSPGETQAENFIAQVPMTVGALPPVVDIEFYGDKLQNLPEREEVRAILDPLLARLEEHYGQKPILYVTYRSYRLYIKGEYEEYPLWVSRPLAAPIDKDWSFWQYSHSARLEGYAGDEERIDLNVFRGSREELEGMTVPEADIEEAVYVPALEESENQKRAKMGEDTYLQFGENDELREELLAYTSYNQLKTPPEQIERYVRMSYGSVRVELFCGGFGEKTSILLFDGEKEPQEFSEEIEYHTAGIGDLTVEDLNFDSNPDLRFFIGGERGGQAFYAAFLWEPETKSYAYASSFSQISTPRFDYEHKVIWAGSDFMFGYYYFAYEFIDGKFINTHSLVGDYPNAADWEKGAQCTEYVAETDSEGRGTVVGQTHFEGDLPSGAVARYIEDGPVWEGWLWCDPHLFEMKG